MLYALGDIHGQTAALDRALDLVAADGGADAPLIFLGDYVDRGPDSRGILDRLIAGRDAQKPWRFLMGNHDRMFLRFVTEARTHDPRVLSGKGWLHPALGGGATLASYLPAAAFSHPEGGGIDTLARAGLDPVPDPDRDALVAAACEAVPQAHLDFIAGLPTTIAEGPHLFVHAGLRPGVPLADQVEDDLIWIRDGFLDHDGDFGALVIHGHTALDRPTHFGNRIDLDGGAGYGRPLVPALFDGSRWFTLHDDGRRPLTPP
jgi:serine/threonine protein phosphatase 1